MRLQQQAGAAPATTRAFWPDAVAYREAIQNPRTALGDPELQSAEVVLDRRGLPLAYSGRFAVVFRLRTPGGDWAIRCFTQASNDGERRERYRAVAEHLERLAPSEHFVSFRYREQGIKVGPSWFPVVLMRWAEGETLGRWVEKNRHEPVALLDLCAALTELIVTLESAGIAHGDWQHDNLLVGEAGAKVTLVDYDGMFVPALSGRAALELGHPNFQHPARSSAHYEVGLDRFSCLALQTALLALSEDGSLWTEFNDGESLLFRKSDFADPPGSPVFAALRAAGGAHLLDSLARLEAACAAPDALLPAEMLAPIPEDLRAAAKQRSARIEADPLAGLDAIYGGKRAASISYLDQARGAAAEARERRFLWGARIVFVALAAMLLWQPGRIPPQTTLLWFGLLFLGGYRLWPPAALRRALRRELKATEAALRRVARWDSPNDFIAFEMARVPIATGFLLGTIGHDTIGRLLAAGIKTAADLRGRWSLRGISRQEWSTLKRWEAWLEKRAMARWSAAWRDRDAVAEREREKAGLQRRREELAGEMTLFPQASWNDWSRALLRLW